MQMKAFMLLDGVCCAIYSAQGIKTTHNCTISEVKDSTYVTTYYMVVPAGGAWLYITNKGIGNIAGGGKFGIGQKSTSGSGSTTSRIWLCCPYVLAQFLTTNPSESYLSFHPLRSD